LTRILWGAWARAAAQHEAIPITAKVKRIRLRMGRAYSTSGAEIN
jgi:hypothetical protein